jgi:gag-polypeptide of LTR copia-type
LNNESKLAKSDNDNAINVILNLISKLIAVLFDNMATANVMWNSLLTWYEGNTQIKMIKLTGLEIKFENFWIDDGETLEDIYTRLMHIQNKFIELGESLSNDKFARKMLRIF